MQTDNEIAQLAEMRKISNIAKTRLGIPEDEWSHSVISRPKYRYLM